MREMWEMWKFEAKPSWCQCWRIAQPVTWPSMPTCDILWPCCDRVSINSSWTTAQLITPCGVVSAAQPECKTTKPESTTFRTARATLEEKANQLGAQHLQLKLRQKSCFTVEISQVHWRKVQNALRTNCKTRASCYACRWVEKVKDPAPVEFDTDHKNRNFISISSPLKIIALVSKAPI